MLSMVGDKKKEDKSSRAQPKPKAIMSVMCGQ